MLRRSGHRRQMRISYAPSDGRNRRAHDYPLLLAVRLSVGGACSSGRGLLLSLTWRPDK